jgi:hypothetical protein
MLKLFDKKSSQLLNVYYKKTAAGCAALYEHQAAISFFND